MADVVFRETSTLGLRLKSMKRLVVERRIQEFQSSLGKVKIKIKTWQNEDYPPHPEYEDCRRLAEEHGIPLQQVYARIIAEFLGSGFKKDGKL